MVNRARPPKAVFLDRDGTLNHDPGYLRRAEDVRLFDEVGPALRLLKDHDFRLIVVSNQSGVSRGLLDLEELSRIEAQIQIALSAFDVTIDGFEYCTHKPEEECACRKPHPLLIERRAERDGIDLMQSVMVGDRATDLQAGHRAGCGRVALVRTGEGTRTEQEGLLSDFSPSVCWVGDHLLDVSRWIVQGIVQGPVQASPSN